MSQIIDELLKMSPYDLSFSDKSKKFLESMRESVQYHYQHSIKCKQYYDNRNFDPSSSYDLESIPYFPVTLFKKMDLLSVPNNEIVRTVHSSSTSNNFPSIIHLDKTTVNRQILALNFIMKDFLGKEKRDFLIIDHKKTVESNQLDLSSRGSAVRGMLSFSKSFNFVLNEDLQINNDLLKEIFKKINIKNCLIFGFTWLIYQIVSENLDNKTIELFSQLEKPIILHIGGWKKLKEISITKEQFNKKISEFFHTATSHVIDVYGMTEQLGTVYPDCSQGYKHVPIYSEILIRDISDQHVLPVGKQGFLQLLSPIPHSYPGISILSDDLCELKGIDDCPCGRKGKYFVFKERSETAELKGCGDTFEI